MFEKLSPHPNPLPKGEGIVEIKTCRHCEAKFEITEKDLEFYEKVSPVFDWKKYLIPCPTLCPDCRQQRRLSFRNERKLYKRKCDFSWKDIISIYSPDKKYKVYDTEIWWSDKWEPLDYWKDFDFEKGFFEQFSELIKNVPFQNSFVTLDSENSNYGNHIWKVKDCYLVSACWNSEKCFYSSKIVSSNFVIDCLENNFIENCFQCISCENCFLCFFTLNSNNCKNSYFLYDCENCDNCFACHNLKNKSYCIKNISYSKEDYNAEILKIRNEAINLWWDFFKTIKSNSINKNLNIINSENCLWDKISNSKNCIYCFDAENCEDCKYSELVLVWKNIYDSFWAWDNLDLWYEIVDTWLTAILNCFLVVCHNCNYTFYSINCYNSDNLFGCIWLRNKQYCILNKQYTKEEYEKLVPKIIEHMMKVPLNKGESDEGAGGFEWWEFFPSYLSQFWYNETLAQEYFPLTKEDVSEKYLYDNWKQIFNWSEYEIPFPKVEKIIPAEKLPDDISKIPDDILNWAIECEKTWKPFRIIKQELEFYRKHNLPIPRKHPDQRYLDRMALRNPRKLFERKCSKCWKDIKTTYSPDRKEIVYCESCYEKDL